jgi:NAD(P)-dependent dehydrogenase (short-subunit alcohol dehydrogenase family)
MTTKKGTPVRRTPPDSAPLGELSWDGPLSGRVALVTGGSRGIGLACAAELGRLGATVVVTATSPETARQGLAALRESGVPRAQGQVADVRDQRQIDALFDAITHAHGHCDVLVNNAGIGGMTPIQSTPDEVWERIIDTNLTGAFRVTRAWMDAAFRCSRTRLGSDHQHRLDRGQASRAAGTGVLGEQTRAGRDDPNASR